MSALGDFLAVLHAPCEPYTAVRASIRHWRDEHLAEAPSTVRAAIGRRKSSSLDDEPSRREIFLSVWLRLPKQFRLERTSVLAEVRRPRWECSDGDSIWECDSTGHVTVKPSSDDAVHAVPTEIGRHFGGPLLREIITALGLEEVGFAETAGRRCVVLKGTPRADGRLWPHWMPCGAESYDLHVDCQVGAVLYIAGWKAGQIFEVHEVMDVAFDEPASDALFQFAAQAGEVISPAPPVTQRLSLETAIEQMPFRILVPNGGEVLLNDVTYEPARSADQRDSVTLFYKAMWLREASSPDPDQSRFDWEAIEHNGRTVLISDPGEGGTLVASIEQDGTHVTICFKGDRVSLLDLATSLVPAKA